ncbi:MAG TPA: hypothetical protein VKS00_02130, partial [Candidatus Acidoferrales bacterium]|nr:hypothetical protein [Candidatus Acidoferrales bacterium]
MDFALWPLDLMIAPSSRRQVFVATVLLFAISAGASKPQFTKNQRKSRFPACAGRLLAVARRNDNEYSFST